MAKKVAAPPTLERAREQLAEAERQLMQVKKDLQVLIDGHISSIAAKTIIAESIAGVAAKSAGHGLAAASEMKRWSKDQSSKPRPEPAEPVAPVPAENPAVTPPRDALNTQEQHVVVFNAAVQAMSRLHPVVQPTQTEVPPVTTPLAEPPIDGSDTPSVPMTPVVPPLAQDNDGLTFPDTLF